MRRYENDIMNRMYAMLSRDKTGIKDGFTDALTAELDRLLVDYFDLLSPATMTILPEDDGSYTVTVTARAARILNFNSTADLK
jgi:hypothetical protein